MRIFLDTSSYAKRFIKEDGSERLEDILSAATELGLSIVSIPELFSAMNRRLREKDISKTQYEEIKNKLSEEIRDIEIIQLTDNIVSSTILLLEKHLLRAFDAIHIASAVEWKADLFLSSDQKQIKAARSAIHKVELI